MPKYTNAAALNLSVISKNNKGAYYGLTGLNEIYFIGEVMNNSMLDAVTYHFSIGMTDKNPHVKDKPKPKPVIQPAQVQPVVQPLVAPETAPLPRLDIPPAQVSRTPRLYCVSR